MKVFNKSRPCPKCGEPEISNRYVKGYANKLCDGVTAGQRDVITRTCFCCKHEWDELPQDSPEGVAERERYYNQVMETMSLMNGISHEAYDSLSSVFSDKKEDI